LNPWGRVQDGSRLQETLPSSTSLWAALEHFERTSGMSKKNILFYVFCLFIPFCWNMSFMSDVFSFLIVKQGKISPRARVFQTQRKMGRSL
jgi:hypothetical protein